MLNEKKASVFVVRVYSPAGDLQSGIMAFRTFSGAEECALEMTPEGYRAEILEVELGD